MIRCFFALLFAILAAANAFSSSQKETSSRVTKESYLQEINRISAKSAADYKKENRIPCLDLLEFYRPRVSKFSLYKSKADKESSLRLVTALDLPVYKNFSESELMQVVEAQGTCRFITNRIWEGKGCPFCKGMDRVSPVIEWGKRYSGGKIMANEMQYKSGNGLNQELQKSDQRILVTWPSNISLDLGGRLYAISSGLIEYNLVGLSTSTVNSAIAVTDLGLGALLCRFQQLNRALSEKAKDKYICGWETTKLDFYQVKTARFICYPKSKYKGRGVTEFKTFLKPFDYPFCSN